MSKYFEGRAGWWVLLVLFALAFLAALLISIGGEAPSTAESANHACRTHGGVLSVDSASQTVTCADHVVRGL